MLRPDYLASLPEPMVALFSQLEADILGDIIRRVVKADMGLTETAVWQAEKLAAIAGSREAVARMIAEALRRSDGEVVDIMESAAAESERLEAPVYRAAGIEIGATPQLTDTLKRWIDNEQRIIRNLTGTVAYRSEQVLVSALDRAYMQVLSGAFDYNTAIRQAVGELSKGGFQVLETKDVYGNVTRRETLEVAVRRAVLTGVNRAAGEVSLARCDEFGASLVEVSAHIGARPSHAEWQGQIYSRHGKKSGYPNFEESTGYGTGEGLCGWNCRHSFYPYFEGAPRAFTDIDREESDTIYEAQQEQRRYERAVRAAKREAEGIRSALAAEQGKDSPDEAQVKQLQADYNKASVKLSARRQALADYLGSAPSSYGLRNDPSRTAVGGFGRSEAARASWAARKANSLFTNGEKRGIIKKNGEQKRQAAEPVTTVSQGAQGSSRFSAEARKRLLRAEMLNNNNRYETARIFDADGNLKFTLKGTRDSVSFTDKQIKQSKGCVITHNHPNGSAFSAEDIYMLKRTGASEMRASTSGGTYVLRQPSKWPSALNSFKAIDTTYNNMVDDFIYRYKDKAAQEGKHPLAYLQKAEEDAVKAFAEKFGLEFSFEKLDAKDLQY